MYNQTGSVLHNKAKQRNKAYPIYIFLGIVLLLYTISMMLPLFWGTFTSVKRQNEFRTNVIWLPSGWPWQWQWDNFIYVFNNFYVSVTSEAGVRSRVGMFQMIVYTILYAGGGAFFATLSPFIVSYACSRFNFKFNKVIYNIVIITMILPIVGSAPSEVQIAKQLKIFDNIPGSWLQKFNFLGMYFLVFLASAKSVPKDFYEAAYVDGAGELKVMLKIAVPLMSKVFFTIMLIKFIELWNDYQTPLIFLPTHPTLAYGIYSLSNSSQQGLNNVPMRMAGCVIMVIPIVILFLAFKDKLMKNVSMGGIKE